jgi:hypothetical protein
LLQEWILRLKHNYPTNRIRQLEWNHVDIMKLQQVNNKFIHAVDLWLNNVVIGFITEFAVDTTKYYSAAEKDFIKGTRGRYIRSLYTSINILLYNNGVMTMESES